MSAPRRIRVMIVDEHAMVRRGLKVVLGTMPDLQVTGEASNGLEAVRICEEQQPDVILMDLRMPHLDGTEATRLIRERWPQVQVLVLTSFQEPELICSVLRAGAIGYLLKNVSADELADAIRAARAGKSTLSPQVLQAMTLEGGGESSPDPDCPGARGPAPREAWG
jgi:NarL family two-component system response regulator LiaR